jgi:MFS family permease
MGVAYGLRAPFVWFGAAGVVALIVMIAFLRHEAKSPPGAPVSSTHPHHPFATLKMHYRILAVAGVGQLFAQMIRAGREIIIPLYAADVIGLDVQSIGLIISTAAAIDMSLFYPAGLLMDRLGRKFAIVPSFLFQAIGMSLLPLTWNFMTLAIVAGLIGFGNGLGSGTMLTLGADLAPKDSRGEFLGLWRLIGDIGFMGGPLVVGTVADLVVLSTAALAMSGAGLMAVLIFAMLVPETLKKQLQVMKVT